MITPSRVVLGRREGSRCSCVADLLGEENGSEWSVLWR